MVVVVRDGGEDEEEESWADWADGMMIAGAARLWEPSQVERWMLDRRVERKAGWKKKKKEMNY